MIQLRRERLVTYLNFKFLASLSFVLFTTLTLWGCGNEKQLTEEQLSLRAGKDLYNKRCSSCHGTNGNGLGSRSGPSLRGPAFIYGGSSTEVRISIAQGRQGGMPAFENALTAQEIDKITDYVLYLAR